MRRPEFLSVIIPAYNEAERLGGTLTRIADFLATSFEAWEIIVVDDGSSDATSDLVRTAQQSSDRFRLLSFSQNRGKGFAVRSGVSSATGDIILFCDADLSTPIEELSSGLEALDSGAAIAIASRGLKSSRILRHQRWYRENMGRMFNHLVRAIVRLPFADTQCGFKLFTRPAAQAIFPECRVDGFAFDVEVLLLARDLGLRVQEFPATWHHAPGSKVHLFRDSIDMLITTIRLRLRSRDRHGVPHYSPIPTSHRPPRDASNRHA